MLESPKASGTVTVTILTDVTMGNQQETGESLSNGMDVRTRLGSLAEAKVIAKLVENGFNVFIQFSGKAPFDLVAYQDGQLLRVQVKGTASKTRYGVYQVQLKAIRSNRTRNVLHYFDPSACDVLAIYIEPLDTVCFLRADEVGSRGQLNLREEPRQHDHTAWVIAELEDVSRILRGHTRGT
jgi:hypothetical protein